MKVIKKTDLAYMAALVDGEGCISLYKKSRAKIKKCDEYRFYLRVSNTDRKMIEDCKKLFGGFIYFRKKQGGRSKHITFTWRVSQNKAIEVLKLILPYLKTKKEKAKLAIKFRGIYNSWGERGRGHGISIELKKKREEIHTRMMELTNSYREPYEKY